MLRCAENPLLTPDWSILGGSVAFVAASIGLGLSAIPAKMEAIFLASLAIIGYLIHRLLQGLEASKRREIVGIALIVFVFRAMPATGAGASWWQIDVLGFDEAFFGTLRQISSILAIVGMFALRGWMSRRPIPYLVVFLSLYGTVMTLPFIGMYYGLHEWTERVFGFGARTIAIVDTMADSPLGQVAMIPMLAWIAREAPREQKATYFAVMAAFTNLALSAASLGTTYLNQIFIGRTRTVPGAGPVDDHRHPHRPGRPGRHGGAGQPLDSPGLGRGRSSRIGKARRMKIGVIGLPLSGRSTIFEALTRQGGETLSRGEDRTAVVRVPDARVDALSRMFEPEKTIYAQVEYLLPGQGSQKKEQPVAAREGLRRPDPRRPQPRAGPHPAAGPPGRGAGADPRRTSCRWKSAWSASSSTSAAARSRMRRKHQLLTECKGLLEARNPAAPTAGAGGGQGAARLSPSHRQAHAGRLQQRGDRGRRCRRSGDVAGRRQLPALRGKLEQELARMSAEDAAEFLREYGIADSAMDRMIRLSYEVLGLLSFFTVGKDEVRAWTIRRGTPAVEAAGVIHTDIQKGFIRAEVIAYDDLMAAGSTAEARKRGTFRLEGKSYEVRDGDIINFRFNV